MATPSRRVYAIIPCQSKAMAERTMKACTDVHYEKNIGAAACVLFREWTDSDAVEEIVKVVQGVAPYESGRFYRRELPCLLEVLQDVVGELEAVIVDGHVWLGTDGPPGLGAHLYQALEKRVPVIGVAKRVFRHDVPAVPVWRGSSKQALYVSSAGMETSVAAEYVRTMHGPFRIPTLLKRVDTLCRQAWRDEL
ncbi:MAG: endonuclease V [Thermodesulfobacteriota bacterium]